MSKMLGGGAPKPPPVPKPPPPTPMADEEAIQRAKRGAAAGLQRRSGRASTVLSDAEDRLGG